jgi:hypothetical protein
MPPEAIILTLNLVVISIGYLLIYPIVAGANIQKITTNDMIASLTSLTVAGSLFWDSAYEFNALFTSLNWFWFTLVSYFILEIPFGLWYLKKYKVFDNIDGV